MSGVPVISLRRLRLLQPFPGGGGGEPNVCLAPAMCLHALSVNANTLHSQQNWPSVHDPTRLASRLRACLVSPVVELRDP